MVNFFRAALGAIKSPKTDVSPVGFLLKSCFYHLRGKHIFSHHNTRVIGLRNISINDRLYIGTPKIGFLTHGDQSFVNVQGRLQIMGEPVTLGKGCRVDIGPGAKCMLEGCAIGGMSRLIIAHHLTIGAGSLISWGCEFLDDDWHTVEYPDRRHRPPGITIGKSVWIGSHVTVLKGVRIADGCVVAARSVVTESMDETNALIAGHPARIIKRNVQWS